MTECKRLSVYKLPITGNCRLTQSVLCCGNDFQAAALLVSSMAPPPRLRLIVSLSFNQPIQRLVSRSTY